MIDQMAANHVPPAPSGPSWALRMLNILAERNSDFRVVFRACFYSSLHDYRDDFKGVRSVIEGHLPLALLNGLVSFECLPRAENWFRELGVL